MFKKNGTACQISHDPDVVLMHKSSFFLVSEPLIRRCSVFVKQGSIRRSYYAVQVQAAPTLGICLGMQLMGLRSEEGQTEGLGLIQAVSRRFVRNEVCPDLRVPGMGWNHVKPVRPDPLFVGLEETGTDLISCIPTMLFARMSLIVWGKQFMASRSRLVLPIKPFMACSFILKKSNRFGMKLLQNFAGI